MSSGLRPCRYRHNVCTSLLGAWLLVTSGGPWAPALASDGGPGPLGYTWADSDSGGPNYSYELSPGPVETLEDDSRITIELGFPFEFFDQVYTELEVHSNGVLSFGGTSTASPSHNCPLDSFDTPSIAAYWTDLEPSEASQNGGIYVSTLGSAPNRRLIIEWFKIPHFNTIGPVTLEVKLFESDGHIEVHYMDVDVAGSNLDNGGAAAIGIGGQDHVLEVSCNTEALRAEFAIGFYPPPPCDDHDGDGYCAWQDCDNQDPSIYPGATEVCDKVDNNCDGLVDEDGAAGSTLWWVDDDADGYGVDGASVPTTSCDPGPGFANNNTDCDDENWAVHPDAHELCDDIDNDCDCIDDSNRDGEFCGPGDEGVDNPPDLDGDSTNICEGDCDDNDPLRSGLDTDLDGQTSCAGDCNDQNASVAVGLIEVCDGLDNDCDDEVDENPNCSSGVLPGHDIPYGCIMNCSLNDRPAGPGPGWLVFVLTGVVLSTRRRHRRTG